jgi:hypothetical protein
MRLDLDLLSCFDRAGCGFFERTQLDPSLLYMKTGIEMIQNTFPRDFALPIDVID